MNKLRSEFEQQLQGLHLELSKQSDKMYFILYAEWLEDKIKELLNTNEIQ